jgi:hypothetical protein
MVINLTNFLLSLGSAIATIAGVNLASDLWIDQAIEGNTSDPYAVLRIYGGPEPAELMRVEVVSVQCMVIGGKEADALALGKKIYEALYDENNLPRHYWDIDAKMIDGTTGGVVADDSINWGIRLVMLRQVPAVISRDTERGKFEVAFNFDVRFDGFVA